MGNSYSAGSAISDLFYPDNPERRGRCQELKNDINSILDEFKYLQALVEDQEKAMEEKVTKLLHAHGYASVKEVEERIEQVLARDELKKWKDMTKELSRDHGIQSWILAISGLGTLATGVVLGGLVVFGVIAGGVAIAAIEVIAPILAVLAVVALVWGAIAGAQERAELQEAIRKLAFSRVEAKEQLEKLKVYSSWMSSFGTWLNEPIFIERPELFEQRITGDFKKDMEGATRAAAIKLLGELDLQRKSWTKEDPDVTNAPLTPALMAAAIAPMAFGTTSAAMGVGNLLSAPVPLAIADFEEPMPTSTLHCTWHDADTGHRTHQMDLRLTAYKDRTDCDAVDTSSGETWLLHAKVYPPLPDVVRLGEVKFRLRNEKTGEVRDDCEVVMVAAAAA